MDLELEQRAWPVQGDRFGGCFLCSQLAGGFCKKQRQQPAEQADKLQQKAELSRCSLAIKAESFSPLFLPKSSAEKMIRKA
jgi:hypothetical protein